MRARSSMSSMWIPCGWLALLLAGAAFSSLAQAETKVDPEVQKHFDLGNDFYGEGRYGDALIEYDEAYRRSKNYKILFNRGQCLVMLRREPEAIESFEQYLKDGGTEIADDRRREVEADLVKLRQRLGTVELEGAPWGAEVTIDGRKVGTTPLKKPILVGAGSHELSVRPATGLPYVKKLDIVAGAKVTDKVEMPKEPPKAPELGLVAPAFALSLQIGVSSPMNVVSRGKVSGLGGVELYGALRPRALYEIGFFVSGASGKYLLEEQDANVERLDQNSNYAYTLAGVRGRLHLLRDKAFAGWIGIDLGAWRETAQFFGKEEDQTHNFDYTAISPVGALGFGIDFPLATNWAIGGAARFLAANGKGARNTCGAAASCGGSFPGSTGATFRLFLEVGAHLVFSIPYGG